ncbi:hypothetical protein RUM43_007603 [Polyplax serrata]|uniref:DNA polymerase n=1 Tax=Polyplax serrata TaxID=468196 RepID=A0AAN8SA77_POLSC
MVEFFKGLTFFILPLGFGKKRLEFFESQIKKFGGSVNYNCVPGVSHVVVEDSVAESRINCLAALKCHSQIIVKESIVLVKVSWLSMCLRQKQLTEICLYEIKWLSKSDEEGQRRPEVVNEGNDNELYDNEMITRNNGNSKSSSDNQLPVCRPNGQVIEELEKLANAYQVQKDIWRCYAYKKAINAIRLHNKQITSFQEARMLPGISDKMALKVMEIIECGKLHKVDEIVDEKTKILDLFCGIWGVGPATAESWYAQGFRCLEDLKERGKLTKRQQIGLNYYDDLQLRIPRDEVLEIYECVSREIVKIHSCLRVELVGSFRRGKETCGDVDLMIINGGPKAPGVILIELTNSLKAQGYITEDLLNIGSEGDNHHSKYFGIFKLPGESSRHRRIDFFVVPKEEYAPALVHYTGSALFNRSIKVLAAKKDMILTEHGLFRGTLRKGSEVMCRGQLVPTATEEDIFNEIGLPYRSPKQRDD